METLEGRDSTLVPDPVRSRSVTRAEQTAIVLVAALALAVPAPGGAAEIPVATPVPVYSSFEDARDLVMADWDLDGDLDLFGAAFASEGVNGWLNEGTHWSPLDWAHGPGPANDLATGDVDGNGRPDLLYVFGDAGGADNKVGVILNRDPDLLVTVESSGLGNPQCVDLGDVDGDGDLDAITCEFGDNEVIWHENVFGNGEGWATQQVAAGVGNPSDAVLHDVDVDGDLDVVVAGFHEVSWIENRLDEPSPGWTSHDVDTDLTAASSVLVGDVTGDGVEEIVAGMVNGRLLAYWTRGSDPTGPWTRSTLQSSYRVADVGLVDVDQDGDLDILASRFYASEGGLRYWENDGSGSFTEHNLGGVSNQIRGSAVGDLDGDGDADFAVATGSSDSVETIENRTIRSRSIMSTASFHRGGSPSPIDVEVADLDRDGDMDLVSFDGDSRLRFRDTAADTGTVLAAIPSTLVSPEVFRLGDVDNDGDLDAVMGFASGLEWLENFGVGNAFAPHTISGSAYLVELELVDLDGNGHLDVVGYDGGIGELRWWANSDDGGDWTASTLQQSITVFHEIAVGDVDHDGLPDVVVSADDALSVASASSADEGGPVVIANGAFTVAETGDFDGDGDTDVAAYVPSDDEIAYWLSDGSGAWSETRVPGPPSVAGLEGFDLELDGDLDLAATRGGDPGRVLVNAGIPVAPLPDGQVFIGNYLALLGDFVDRDGDGDTDVVGIDGGDFVVALNHRGQYSVGGYQPAPQQVSEGEVATLAEIEAVHLGVAGDQSLRLLSIELHFASDGAPLSGSQIDQLFESIAVERVSGTTGTLVEVVDPAGGSPLRLPFAQTGGPEVLEATTAPNMGSAAFLEVVATLEPDAADTVSSFDMRLEAGAAASPATDSMGTPLARIAADHVEWSFTVLDAIGGLPFEDGFESASTSAWSSTVP